MTSECYTMNIKGHSYMTAWVRLYSEDFTEVVSEEFYKISGYRIVDPEHNPDEVKEIEESTDASGIDPESEYLILYLKNGETATFRNSLALMDLHYEKI